MEFAILIENTATENLVAEHGLSIIIEHECKKILLDAGTTESFYDNAKAINVSFENLDACVLSHGHYDHSGGFDAILRENKNVKIYAQKSAAGKYLSANGGIHEISVPENVRSQTDRFVYIDGQQEIFSDIYLIPHISNGLEKIGEKSKLYKEVDGEILPDDFKHEQSLVYDTEKGLVIFNSCSHGGVKNIIEEVRSAIGNKPIYAYVGGLHMKGQKDGIEICTFSNKEIDELCQTIENAGIKYIYTGHCTGETGLKKLKERLGDKVIAMKTGMKVEL